MVVVMRPPLPVREGRGRSLHSCSALGSRGARPCAPQTSSGRSGCHRDEAVRHRTAVRPALDRRPTRLASAAAPDSAVSLRLLLRAHFPVSMRSAITPQGRGQNYGRKKREVLRLIVGSPGDVRAEREAVHRVCAELNRTAARVAGSCWRRAAGTRMPIRASIPSALWAARSLWRSWIQWRKVLAFREAFPRRGAVVALTPEPTISNASCAGTSRSFSRTASRSAGVRPLVAIRERGRQEGPPGLPRLGCRKPTAP